MSRAETNLPPNAPPLQVELLYFDGCPSYQTVWNDLLEVVREHDLDVTVRPIKIGTLEKADALHFAGSPSVTVNGVDLEYYEGTGVLACRVYRENEGRGYPSRKLLRERLTESRLP